MKIADGNLYIKFSKIHDHDNTNLTLDQYISDQIMASTGPIYGAIDAAVQRMSGQLSSAIGGISQFRNHGHHTDWQTIDLYPPIGPAVSFNAGDCYVTVYSSNSPSSTAKNEIKLSELFNVGGVSWS